MPFCTCGCRAQVTYATKISHLNGKGKTTLRSRVAAENEWLTKSTSLRQISKKRSHSTADQNHSRTRRKAAQPEVEAEPGIILADAHAMEALPEPVAGHIPPTFRADEDPFHEPVAAQVPPTFHVAADPQTLPEPVAAQVPPTFHAAADLLEPVVGQVPPTFHADGDLHEPQVPPTFHVASDPLPEPVAAQVLYADADPMELLHEPFDQVPQRPQEDADANLRDPLPDPDVILAVQKERLRGIEEERWGNGVLHEGSSGVFDDSSEDDEDTLVVPESESESEDNDNDDGNDDDSALFVESDVAGISSWDMLREGFECEAATIGSFLPSRPFSSL